MAALTQADVDRLKAKLDAGDRAGFYLLYHDLTGSNQALTRAEVSSFSGELGRQAMHTNAAVQAYLWAAGRADQYPGPVENFSQMIAEDLYNHIAKDVENGRAGIFRDREIFDFAKKTWEKNGIGDCFPGNLVDSEVSSAPMCSRVAATLGGMRAAAEWLDAIGPVAPDIPPGGRQLRTADGQATYIIDSRGMVVPGSVQRIQAAPRPFDFDGTQPDDHGQIYAPGWAGQAASVAPNNGSSGSYPWPGITADGIRPWIPALALSPPPAPGGPFDWLQSDLLGKVGGLVSGGAFAPPQSSVSGAVSAPLPQTRIPPQSFAASPPSPFGVPVPPALQPLVPHFFPQWLDTNNAQAWPSSETSDDPGMQPNLAGSSTGAGLGLAVGGQLAPQPFAAPSSPFSVPVPPALQPLVPHFFPQWLDTSKAQAWPSARTSVDAGVQPNPVGNPKTGLALVAGGQPTPQPFPAPPPSSSPFSVPVPPALQPLVKHFFPEWLDTNNA